MTEHQEETTSSTNVPIQKQAKITEFSSVKVRKSTRLANKVLTSDSPSKTNIPNISDQFSINSKDQQRDLEITARPVEERSRVIGGLVSADPEYQFRRSNDSESEKPLAELIFKEDNTTSPSPKAKQARIGPSPQKLNQPLPVPFSFPTTSSKANVISTIEPNLTLPFPPNFELALKTFLALDNQCLIALGRSQMRLIFHQIKDSIERSTGRSFSLELLGKITAVWPEAFQLSSTSIIVDGKRKPSVYISTGHASNPKELERRRASFRSRLLALVLEAHDNFLKAQGIELPNHKNLINWHPKFDLKACDIPSTSILIDESGDKEVKPKSGSVSDRITAALDAKDAKLLESIKPSTIVNQSAGDPEKKLKLSLRDRIKLKENQAAEDSMSRRQEDHKKLVESLKTYVEPLQMIFVVARKASLPSSYVYHKLIDTCSTPMTLGDIKDRISLLAKVVSVWLIIKDADTDKEYIRLDNSRSVRQIEKLIDDYAHSQSL